jgi:integrase
MHTFDGDLTDFYRDYFEPLFLRSRSENTRRLYRTSIRTFSKYLQRPARLEDLNDLTVNRFLDYYRRIPRSPYSANKERSNLLAIWRFACRKRFLEEWPDVMPDVEPDRIPQAWTADQIARLLATCERLPGRVGQIPASTWWRTLHLVCWDTGERIGAVRDLEWHHVDLVARYVLVPAELRKGKRRDRLYRLAEDTTHALQSMPRTTDSYVFPWPYCRTYLWYRYDRLLTAAGLPHDRHSKFHRIRRTVATYYEAAGGNATELLGHSTRSVTLAYLDPRILPPQHAADLLFRITDPPDFLSRHASRADT